MTNAILNIASYKFVELNNLDQLKVSLLAQAESRAIKGTILLAHEGINLFLAGSHQAIHEYSAFLRGYPEFADLDFKESLSDDIPFKKMLVKIKHEIIRMNHPTIKPINGRAPVVSPATLARWLRQGHDDNHRPVVMLDTRNDYEVDTGTFENVIDWRLKKFTEFPDAIKQHQESLQDKTVIGFCTGGIRCEKAVLYMQDIGMHHVYQLEGGILKYFEETDGYGYDGACFVFDERRAVNKALEPTPDAAVEAYETPSDRNAY